MKLPLSHFDRLVLLTIAGSLVVLALILWRGDQVSVQAIALSPPPDAQGVSTRTQIEIRFDQPMAAVNDSSLLVAQPALRGTLRSNGAALLFAPTTGLLPNTTYTITLAAGLRSQQGYLLRQPVTWRFRTGQLEALYSAIDANGVEQLYLAPVDLVNRGASGMSAPVQVTNAPGGIWDFAVAPNGSEIVFAALEENGTSDLWSARLGDAEARQLVECADAVCSGANWSPDGRFLAYSRRTASEFSSGVVSPPRLWLVNPTTGENSAVFTDSQKLAFEPRWSSDGQYLSYLSPDLGGVGTINLYDGGTQFYETPTGEPGIWRPLRSQLLINVMRQLGETYVIHLLLIDANSNQQRNLSGEESMVEDGSPAWSPDGDWVAFRRKELEGPGATLGKQLWLMRGDGSEVRALTADPAFDHGQPVWSPDGRYLLFHKLPLKGPEIILSVWVIDTQTGELWEVARPGQRPVWMP
jgi:Tol biopolymer transport system component